MDLNNEQYEKLKNDVVNSLLWRGVGGLISVLALTIAVATQISGKDGQNATQPQVDNSVRELLELDP